MLKIEQARALSPLTLAFYGDSVYEEMVRRAIVEKGSAPSSKLHKAAVTYVRASFQAAAAERITPLLTDIELDILRRGRNANVGTVPKSTTPALYHKATALEALFGYLNLTNQTTRLLELFEVIYYEKETSSCTTDQNSKASN